MRNDASLRPARLLLTLHPPVMYLYQSIALAPYFNYLESAPARELFAFQDAESVPAIKFIDRSVGRAPRSPVTGRLTLHSAACASS